MYTVISTQVIQLQARGNLCLRMSGKKSIFHYIEHFANLSRLRQAENGLKNEKTYWNLQCLVSGSIAFKGETRFMFSIGT